MDRNYLFGLCRAVLVINRTHDGQLPWEGGRHLFYFTVIVAVVPTHPLLQCSQIWRLFLHRFLPHGKYHFHDNVVRILRYLRFSQRCLFQYEVCLHFLYCRRRVLSRTVTKSVPSIYQQTDCGFQLTVALRTSCNVTYDCSSQFLNINQKARGKSGITEKIFMKSEFSRLKHILN
jgi:hypothetical protein